tara:strand:+ start:1260 stop:2324 length:1065 start_codon:yes stop_codon:yes gene_type:complete
MSTIFNPDVDPGDEYKQGALVSRPMTKCTKSNELFKVGEMSQPETGCINMWDILNNKEIQLPIDSIIEWSMATLPVPQDRIGLVNGKIEVIEKAGVDDLPLVKTSKHEQHDWAGAIERLSSEMKELSDCKSLADDTKLQNIMMRNDCDKTAWAVLKAVGFKCDCVSDLVHASEETMCEIRDGYMNNIREHRKISFEELDQLEQEARDTGATDDDIKDIDTIKQMFRDIPQETDLTKYKTVSELFDFWPSLILPSPINYSLKSYVQSRSDLEHPLKQYLNKLDTTHVDQIKNILKLTEQQRLSEEQIIIKLKQESMDRGDMFPVPEDSYRDQARDLIRQHDEVIELLTIKLKELV